MKRKHILLLLMAAAGFFIWKYFQTEKQSAQTPVDPVPDAPLFDFGSESDFAPTVSTPPTDPLPEVESAPSVVSRTIAPRTVAQVRENPLRRQTGSTTRVQRATPTVTARRSL